MLFAIFVILLALVILMGAIAFGFLWAVERWGEREERRRKGKRG